MDDRIRILIHGFLKKRSFALASSLCGHKTGILKTERPSVFKSVYVPIVCSHEFWLMTLRIPSQVQAAETVFLRRVQGVRLRDKCAVVKFVKP